MVDKKNNSNFVYISLVAIVAIVAVVVLLSGTGQRNAIMTDDMLAADANIGGQASYSKYAQKALPTKQEILPPKQEVEPSKQEIEPENGVPSQSPYTLTSTVSLDTAYGSCGSSMPSANNFVSSPMDARNTYVNENSEYISYNSVSNAYFGDRCNFAGNLVEYYCEDLGNGKFGLVKARFDCTYGCALAGSYSGEVTHFAYCKSS